jgi:hypothetical protein
MHRLDFERMRYPACGSIFVPHSADSGHKALVLGGILSVIDGIIVNHRVCYECQLLDHDSWL